MARISTYAVDSEIVTTDKVLGTDSQGLTTKNFSFSAVKDWLNSSAVVGVVGQNTYTFQTIPGNPVVRDSGSISLPGLGGDGAAFADITSMVFSERAADNSVATNYINTLVGKQVVLMQLDNLDNFGIYNLDSFTPLQGSPGFYTAALSVDYSNGNLVSDQNYGFAVYGLQSAGATWGSITGVITNQTDLVNYVDTAIGNIPPPVIPTPPTPTLQSVTDEGNTTTNDINLIGDGSGIRLYLKDDPTDANDYAYIQKSARDVNWLVRAGSTNFRSDGSGAFKFFPRGQQVLYIDYDAVRIFNGTWNNDIAKFETSTKNSLFYGNVGIGTTAPQQKLHVGGVLMAQNIGGSYERSIGLFPGNYEQTLKYSGTGLIIQNSSNDNDLGAGGGNVVVKLSPYATNDRTTTLSLGNKNQQSLVHTSANGLLTINNATSGGVMAFDLNGNVGIGTTAPAPTAGTKGLHLVAPANQSSEIKLDTTDSDRGTYLTFAKSGISKWDIYSPSDNSLRFRELQVPSTTALTLLDGGNVGIGTTTPSEKLEVDGNIISTWNNNRFIGIQFDDGNDFKNGLVLKAGDRSTGLIAKASNNNPYIWFGTGSEPVSERMRITNTGNVGIGTTAPLYPLDLVSNNSANTAMLRVRSANDVGNIRFASYDGSEILGSLYFQREGAGTGNLRFYTSNANNNQERLRITPTGNVGIGTTAPTEKLHVAGNVKSTSVLLSAYGTELAEQSTRTIIAAQDNRLDILNIARTLFVTSFDRDTGYHSFYGPGPNPVTINAYSGTISKNNAYLDLYNNQSGNVRLFNQSTNATFGNVIFGTSDTERMRITSDGNVGIGTTAPSHLFSVNNKFMVTSTGSAFIPAGQGIGIDPYSGGAATNIYFNTGNVQVTGATDFIHNNASFIVKNSGNVGIGTTVPDSKLHVKATSGIAFKVDPNDADKEWYIDTTNPDHLKKEGNLILNADPTNVHTSTKISFNIDGSNKASINSDGDLGVGTTAQTSKVHVDGTAMRQLRMGTSGGPSSNTDTSGAIGDMAYDDNYFYIKTINGWGRVPLDFGF